MQYACSMYRKRTIKSHSHISCDWLRYLQLLFFTVEREVRDSTANRVNCASETTATISTALSFYSSHATRDYMVLPEVYAQS